MMQKKYSLMLSSCNSVALRSLQRRSIHTIAAPASNVIQGETPIAVYEPKEHSELKKATGYNWDSEMLRSSHKGKVFSLLPFFVESAFTRKNFVLRMDLYPKAELLQIDVLRMNGVISLYVPINNVIPITRYDYWAASWKFWCKQHQCLDLDMIYANRITKEMYVFDKDGEWNDDGVYHEALSMDKTYNETNWYDEFSVHNF